MDRKRKRYGKSSRNFYRVKRRKYAAGTNSTKLGKAAAIASGGALGYITNNVGGAVVGAQLAAKAYDWTRKKKYKYKKKRIPISKPNDMTIHKMGVIKLPGARMRLKGKTMATFSYRNVNQWIVTYDYDTPKHGQGRQVVDFAEALMTRNMIVGDTSGDRKVRDKVADDFFKLNPFWSHVRQPVSEQPNPALPPNYSGTLYPNLPPLGQVPVNESLALKGVDISFSLLSMTTAPCIVQVYWVTPYYDTDQFPTETFNDAVIAAQYGQNSSTNAQSVGDTDGESPGSASPDNWGENPYKYQQFRKMWRCLRKQEMILQPGDQRHFSGYFKYNKMFNRQTFNEIRTQRSLAGITVYPLLIVRAGLVGLRSGTTGYSKEVSYGIPKVGVMVNSHYKFAALPINQISTSRIFKGHIEDTTDNLREIHDDDKAEDEVVN